MNTVRKILVPVDFSETSANNLKYAVSLAQETRADLVVLHVAQKIDAEYFLDLLAVMEGSPMLNPPAPVPFDRLLQEKALDLYHFIETVVKNSAPLKITRKVILGRIGETILRVTKEENIDLVILGVRKKTFFPYLTARRKILQMISKLPCPVLLTPGFGEPWPQLA